MAKSKAKSDRGVLGWFDGFGDQIERLVGTQLERLVSAASRQADRLAESAADRFAQRVVDQFEQQLAMRLVWALSAAGALLAAVWLIVVGAAGALGELLGRPWLGQLATGALLLVAAVVAAGLARARSRKRDKGQESEASTPASASKSSPDTAHAAHEPKATVQAASELLRQHPLAGAAAVGAAGVVAGSLLPRATNGRFRKS